MNPRLCSPTAIVRNGTRKLHIEVSFRLLVHWWRVALTNGGICVGNFPPLHLMTDSGPGSETLCVEKAQYSKQCPSDAYSSLLSLYLGVQMFMACHYIRKGSICLQVWSGLIPVGRCPGAKNGIWNLTIQSYGQWSLRSKYYPQHPLLKDRQSVFFL